MKNLNRKIVLFVAVLLMLAGPLKAQVYIMDEEFEGTLRSGYEDFELTTPYEGGDTDQQYAPVGNGLLALTLLGGAYLLTKRKKKDEEC